jgi:hypothetical protein
MVHLPDLFPCAAYKPHSTIYYLSWPSWEKCVAYISWDNPTSPPPLNINLKATLPPEAKPLTIEGPDKFLESLALIKGGLDKVGFQDSLLPFAKGLTGPESQKGILEALGSQAKEPLEATHSSYSHMVLAIFTLKLLANYEASQYLSEAYDQNIALWMELTGPDLEETCDDLLNISSSFPDGRPEDNLPEYQARWILKNWFSLASGVLKNGDLLRPHPLFLPLLKEDFPADPNNPGVLIYERL